MISSAKERGKRILKSLNLEYLTVCFDYNYFDSKQRALKVYINTFYKEAGNSKSLIFLYKLACETITVGKYNLNFVIEFVLKKGFRLKYENTDSLYLTCPNRYYKKCNEAFSRKELSKEAYWLK
ncbi:15186_t:CDS:1 [Funneliformis caledonium]|uniref:15186_t:CDS:1 n=1 Tax=Funneliformis caledonium TaxID=1117310 RepID=A0A9N8W606_9GLOM|nr:15186_t:CDS:1 [Funneliformis caledonium]